MQNQVLVTNHIAILFLHMHFIVKEETFSFVYKQFFILLVISIEPNSDKNA